MPAKKYSVLLQIPHLKQSTCCSVSKSRIIQHGSDSFQASYLLLLSVMSIYETFDNNAEYLSDVTIMNIWWMGNPLIRWETQRSSQSMIWDDHPPNSDQKNYCVGFIDNSTMTFFRAFSELVKWRSSELRTGECFLLPCSPLSPPLSWARLQIFWFQI